MKRKLWMGLCLLATAMQAQDDVNYVYADSLFQRLPEVMVKGERPVVKAERGRLVYDLPRLAGQLAVRNAYELIAELPGVVEQDGRLTLGGRPLTLVVDGKVSTLGPEELKAMLEAIPVSRLAKAEVMYAAPARYHVRGAMINVVLASATGQAPSLSGEVSAAYEQTRRAGATGRGSLLFASRRLSADLMYAYNYRQSAWSIRKQARHTVDGGLNELTLGTDARGTGGRHQARMGVDYDLHDGQKLSLVYNLQYRQGTDNTTLDGTLRSDKQTEGHQWLHNVKADYRSSSGLTAGADWLYYASPGQTDLRTQGGGAPETRFVYDENQRIRRYLFYLSQVHTLGEATELNYGARYTTTRDDSHQRLLAGEGASAADASTRRRREYTLNAYGGASHAFSSRLSGEVSLALELYHAAPRHLWQCYPTLNLTYIPADGHTLQFSFTSDHTEPDYWQLQPIVAYVDGYTEEHGNPDLRPSSDYTAEVQYLFRNRYMLGVDYSYMPHYFTQLPYQLPDRLAEVNQVVNFDYRKQWTLQAMASYRPASWWSGRLFAFGIFVHERDLHFHDVPFDRRQCSFLLNTSNTFTLAKRPRLQATLSGFFQSRAIQGVYDIRPLGWLNASLQWTSDNDVWRVWLKGDDLLLTSNPLIYLDQGVQQGRTELHRDKRCVSLSVSCRLGGYKEKKRAEVDTGRLGR